ncbi:Fe-S cluster assembly protein DRE2 [Gracilaria domingensis]|nr:Fe-S cluster assembly protein DRE2 [Gracilaria domingensis]
MVKNLTQVDQESLISFASSAAPGTQVSLQVPNSDTAAGVRVRLTLAGFIDIKDTSASTITASLPSYEQGTSVSLSDAPKAPSSNAWATALSSNEQVALVDENELLKRDGIPDGDGKGCAPDSSGKRKPCKDCSCGLADVYEEQQQSTAAPKSSCGNCSLGDAFRCASCPYLGLPPFKPGEKVAIPTSFMTSDI